MNRDNSYETVRERALAILRKRILNNEIKPGERIKELEVSKELKMSRGSIREALRHLEQEGLVSYSYNRGCTVREISPRYMAEVCLIRSALEVLAVKIYLGNMRESAIEKLEKITDEMQTMTNKNDIAGIVEKEEEFHSTIVRESNVDILHRTWKSYEGGNAAVYYALNNLNIQAKDIKADHLMIVDAFREKDLSKICQLIHRHYMIHAEKLYEVKDIGSDEILEVKFKF